MGSEKEELEPSGISYVEFYLDGTKLGETYFPNIENRKDPDSGKGKIFEVWRYDNRVGEISVHETSKSFYAVVHSEEGGEKKTSDRLIRVVENKEPEVRFLYPNNRSSVSIGQNVNMGYEISDEMLSDGVVIELFLNGKSFDKWDCTGRGEKKYGHSGKQTTSFSYAFPVTEEMAGAEQVFYFEVTDIQGKTGRSEPLRLVVKNDQVPGVVLTSPIEGARLVSGLPFEIRADAADDIGVNRVDFFVDGRFAGSDSTRPFSLTYKPLTGLQTEQVLNISASVIDTAGQEAKSAPVHVTLGKDSYAPVINIVSPVVEKTSEGLDFAEATENGTILIKVTGYDNVGVERLELRGVTVHGDGFQITGNREDLLGEARFEPQQVFDKINAFSAVLLAGVPEPGNYPIGITAYDKAGNSSEATVVIQVQEDSPPIVKHASLNNTAFFPVRRSMSISLRKMTWPLSGWRLSAILITHLRKFIGNRCQAYPVHGL